MIRGLVLDWAVLFAVPLVVALIAVPFLLRRSGRGWAGAPERAEPALHEPARRTGTRLAQPAHADERAGHGERHSRDEQTSRHEVGGHREPHFHGGEPKENQARESQARESQARESQARESLPKEYHPRQTLSSTGKPRLFQPGLTQPSGAGEVPRGRPAPRLAVAERMAPRAAPTETPRRPPAITPQDIRQILVETGLVHVAALNWLTAIIMSGLNHGYDLPALARAIQSAGQPAPALTKRALGFSRDSALGADFVGALTPKALERAAEAPRLIAGAILGEDPTARG